jgi:hypothetical protein
MELENLFKEENKHTKELKDKNKAIIFCILQFINISLSCLILLSKYGNLIDDSI